MSKREKTVEETLRRIESKVNLSKRKRGFVEINLKILYQTAVADTYLKQINELK